MSAVAFWPFGEDQEIPPSDVVGNVGDLGVETGINPPLARQGWSGGGRHFVPSNQHGLFGADNDGRDSLLTRSMTVQTLCTVELSVSSGPMTLVCRGLDGSAAEYYGYGVEILAGSEPNTVDVRWFWMGQDGTLYTQTAGTYEHPGDSRTVLITATRRWESTSRVVLRYYVADHLIGEVISNNGDIGGGTTGHLSIGARKTGGNWGRYFAGTVEQLAIWDYEMSAEEIEATWRRMAIHQREGVQRMRALSPRGAPWSTRPEAAIALAIRQAGELVGAAASLADESRNILPDRAYVETIQRWETLVGVTARPLDSLDTRRSRIVAYLSRENGFSLPVIRGVMAPVPDLDPTDVEIREFTNTVYEPFDVLREERWHLETPSAWSISGGVLRCQLAPGDVATVANPGMVHAIQSLPPAERGAVANEDGTTYQIHIAIPAAWPASATNMIVGMVWWEGVGGDALWVGVTKSGSDYLLVERSRIAGVVSAPTTIANVGSYPHLYLRVRRMYPNGLYQVERNTTGFLDAMTVAAVTGPTRTSYVGQSVICDSVIDAGEALDISFDEATLYAPKGRRPFFWYVYRHPSLPSGSPDMVGARLLTQRYKPAHTHAYAITSFSLLCDSPESVLDGGPMGGF